LDNYVYLINNIKEYSIRFKIESIQPKTPFAKEITTAYISISSSAPTALFYTLKLINT